MTRKKLTKSLPQSGCVLPIFCEVHGEERKIEPSKIMSQEKNRLKSGPFGWNELATTNVAAAKKFYTGLLGWKTKPFGQGVDYTLFLKGRDSVGGLIQCPSVANPRNGFPMSSLTTWMPRPKKRPAPRQSCDGAV